MDIQKMYNAAYLKQLAENKKQEHKKVVQKIKMKKPKNLDSIFAELHQDKFSCIDCLHCANCCRNLGPRILDRDIQRLSKYLKMKPNVFIEKYLRVDEDSDYVFKQMPCPFLASDNYCLVYEHRPKACADYPHTDHKKMLTHINLAVKNAETCPAVFLILEDLAKNKY